MKIAIVGCGWVADLYMDSLPLHPRLELLGVFDKDPSRCSRFSSYYGVYAYTSLESLLADHSVDLVVNLASPVSHFGVSEAALESGKHVYTEKPMTLDLAQSRRLVQMAERRGLTFASAPCNLLGETAQTLWQALHDQRAGDVHLAYAEIDDGPVYQMRFDKWISPSGSPWPAQDEFAMGCALEHAGYYLTWLAAFFGPARTVTAFSACQIPEKLVDPSISRLSPDFSVACIQFESGMVARLTTSTLAPHDHGLRVIGKRGVLSTKECWSYSSPVYLQRWTTVRRKTFLNPWRTRLRFGGQRDFLGKRRGATRMDWCRGPAEVAASIEEGRPCRLPADFCLHVNELELAISQAGSTGSPYRATTTFAPLDPLFRRHALARNAETSG